MKNELIQTINAEFKNAYPIFLQGSLAADAKYPPSFFTFWNNTTYDFDAFDNAPTAYVWDFDLNFYSTNPTLVNTVLAQAQAALKNNGWLISGVGYDVASDEVTHTGRGINVLYVQKIIKEEV